MLDWGVGDLQRDARSYYRLLSALELAKEEIRAAQRGGGIDIDGVLGRLLPVLAEALNAEQAFVAVLRQDEMQGSRGLQLVAVHPRVELCGQALGWSDLLARLVVEGEPLVIDPLDRTPSLIPGLDLLDATSAILVRMQIGDLVRIVGVCNKAHPELGPYLAADKMALDSILELLAIGAQVGEQHRQEREGIQKTSAAIGMELELSELLPMIAQRAAQVFDVPAASLMLWDEGEEHLVIQAKWGLSDEYATQQRIDRTTVLAQVEAAGGYWPIMRQDLQSEPLGDIELICSENLRTVLAAPLLIREELIGCLNIYSKHQVRPFTHDEQELAQIFANQAAIAIRNARLYDASNRQREYLLALLEASKAIAKGFTASRKEVLDHITEQAVERITGIQGPQAAWSTILLCDENASELLFESVYPSEILPALQARLGQGWSLDRGQAPGERIGITGRTVLQRKPQRIADICCDPDYLEFAPNTRSELTVPMVDGDRILGVLNVESDQVGAFDADDERALQGLAEMAVIAIKNTENAAQLSRTDAVAMLSVWGADVAHDVNREVGAIRRAIFLLQQRDDLPAEVKERLHDIDDYADRLALPELPDRTPASDLAVDFADAPFLDAVIQAEVSSLRSAYPAVTLGLDLGCADARVAIHEQWLRRLVRHLIRNAVNAILPDHPKRSVTVRTLYMDHIAEVQVEDTGKGVRPEIRQELFQQPIAHPDGRSGRGLLLVRFLAEQHGGYARLVWSRQGKGSCFAFGVPLARPASRSAQERIGEE